MIVLLSTKINIINTTSKNCKRNVFSKINRRQNVSKHALVSNGIISTDLNFLLDPDGNILFDPDGNPLLAGDGN